MSSSFLKTVKMQNCSSSTFMFIDLLVLSFLFFYNNIFMILGTLHLPMNVISLSISSSDVSDLSKSDNKVTKIDCSWFSI
jgi:hypothetical protein